MSRKWKTIANGAVLFCLSLVAAGCGSDSSAPSPETITISGKAVKGPIANALVTAYKMDALGKQDAKEPELNHTTSDANGNYTMKILKNSGPIIVAARGTDTSTYASEADPAGAPVRFTANETLRAAVTDPAAVASIQITPFTEMAVIKLQEYAASAPAGTPIANLNIAAANTIENAIKTMVGATNFSVSDVGTPSGTAALTLFAQLLATRSAADPTINSTTLAQSFVNAITVGGNDLAVLNTQIADAATALQSKGIAIVTPTPIAVATTPDFSDVTPPTAPTNLNGSAAFNEVALTWSASTDAAGVAGYFVYRDNIRIAAITAPGYTDASVNAATTYVYSIRAYDASGNISEPVTLSVVTPAAPLPGSLNILVNVQVRPQ